MDTSPTALFDQYESDFNQTVASVRDKLGPGGGDDRRAALRRVEMELDEADEMVSQMEIEIQGIPQSIRPTYQARVRGAKQGLAQLKKQAKDSHQAVGRSELMGARGGGPTSDDPYAPASDRTRLLAGTSMLEDGSRRLQESQRIALETEETGADILRNLRGQREQIESSRNTLNTADTAIDRASGTLNKMIRRMYQQRVVTGAIIVVLVILICIIVYEKVFG